MVRVTRKSIVRYKQHHQSREITTPLVNHEASANDASEPNNLRLPDDPLVNEILWPSRKPRCS